MQAPTPTQRSSQRRSPAADSLPPPSVPPRTESPGTVVVSRSSMTSTKSGTGGGGSRRQNGAAPSQGAHNSQPLSQIEKSVTHLLVATKQLLETLTAWSRQQATDAQVSDVYVRLGYEFNIACRAFTAINVEVSDLGNVPELLRDILEATLSQEASVESLDKYLPRIRDIIITLLHGLKRKQQKLRQKQSREGSYQNVEAPVQRIHSVSSIGSSNTGLTTMLNEGIPQNFQDSRENSMRSIQDGVPPPRMSSNSTGSPSRRELPPRDQSRGSLSSEQSSLSSTTMQSIPVLQPYPGDETSEPAHPGSGELTMDTFPPPPPPPPKQQAALRALQNGGDLERRASRRYSAYHISKQLGSALPVMPPPQNSPIPNRGRDVKESMNAIRGRGSYPSNKQQPRFVTGNSPNGDSILSSEQSLDQTVAYMAPEVVGLDDSPRVHTPVDEIRNPLTTFDHPPSATLQPLPSDALAIVETDQLGTDTSGSHRAPQQERETSPSAYTAVDSIQNPPFVPEQSPQPGKELTLFLQYKTKIKKFVLNDGYNDLSMARLQLAFIEKFAWNTHNNGVDLPEIYLQDPVSGVRHELEDLTDIKDRSVLVLNVEALDEVKRHIDEGLVGLKRMVEGVKAAVDDQKETIQRVSDRQQETAKEMTRLASAPPTPRISVSDAARANGPIVNSTKISGSAHAGEIQSLRRDLAVLRQTYLGFQADIENSMSKIRTKANSVKAVAIKAAIPDMAGDAGRTYVNAGKKTLNEDSDKLVSRVDDLQDIVEDLRKDVVLRGVRPLPRQLEVVAKDISQAAMELKKMQDYLKRERPIWTKIWEKELETVCNDREELTLQEDLAADLQDDLEKATQTFALVEQATKEQMKDAPGGSSSGRNLSRGKNHVIATDPSIAKEGVLDEVRALQPNHENRLEAIERAEKLRQKELEGRGGDEFQKELGDFVEEGKLKKAGGVEEVERARKAKDERIRREVWERQNGMTQADAIVASDEATDGTNDEELEGTNKMTSDEFPITSI